MSTVRCLECDTEKYLESTKLKSVDAWGSEPYYFRCRRCKTPHRIRIRSGKLIEVRGVRLFCTLEKGARVS